MGFGLWVLGFGLGFGFRVERLGEHAMSLGTVATRSCDEAWWTCGSVSLAADCIQARLEGRGSPRLRVKRVPPLSVVRAVDGPALDLAHEVDVREQITGSVSS